MDSLPPLSWKVFLFSRIAIVVCTGLAFLQIVYTILRHPILFFKRTKRITPPKCMLDSTLGKHEYIRANGIKFHYVTCGNPSKPLMLFLHGFPEFWYSWRYQMKEFSREYHVVAVDLRGYGETDCPPNLSDYFISHLSKDVVELIPALGHEKAILVAHDWGGAIAWVVTHQHPHLIEKLVVLNCPHPVVFVKTLSITQLMMSWYAFFFQVPWVPEFVMSACDYKTINSAFRGKIGGVCNRKAFTREDVQAYQYVFSQDGAITPPLNYYRANVLRLAEYSSINLKGTIEVPTLVIWGDNDIFLHCATADHHGSVVKNLCVMHIPNCSHWAQNDSPELVNQYIREFVD